MTDTPQPPPIDPPDPFEARGPHGSHVRFGPPTEPVEAPEPDPAPAAPGSYHHGHRQPPGPAHAAHPPPPPPPAGGAYAAAAPPAYPSSVYDERDARTYAAFIHASSLVATFLGPLILWLILKDRHVIADRAGREALNFHISMWIWGAISALLVILIIGIPMLMAVGIMSFILPIIAAIKAANGQEYRYPFTIRLL